jgi:DNA polymerase-3 subunit delta
MQQTADQFVAKPPAPNADLAPLYVIHGAEPLSALEAADTIRRLAREAGYVEREVLTAEPGFDWDALVASGSALSLFASRRLLELRIPSGKPGRDGGPAIEAFCQRLPDETITLVILPEVDWQGQKTKWFAALAARAVLLEAKPIERSRLPAWLAARMKRNGQTAADEVLETFADRVEGNMLAAQQEIDKLALLCPRGAITHDAIEHGVADVARFNTTQWIDAIASGDAPRVRRVLDGLQAEGEPLPFLLWLTANELRILARMVGLTESGRAPFPGKARQLEGLARRHTAKSVRALMLRAAEVDRLVKGIGTRDAWDALADLGCAMAGKPLMHASLA